MTREDHLLVISMEECNEVAQRISKALRFGLNQIQEDIDDMPEQNPEHLTNRDRIINELNDLLSVLDMLDLNVLNSKKMYLKQQKIEQYLIRSIACNRLT